MGTYKVAILCIKDRNSFMGIKVSFESQERPKCNTCIAKSTFSHVVSDDFLNVPIRLNRSLVRLWKIF